jgi:hypothetical protein
MNTKVPALVLLLTFVVGVAAAQAVLPNTPGYDSVVLSGSSPGNPIPGTSFRRIYRAGTLAANPFVIPASKVLVITEFSTIANAPGTVTFTLNDNTVLVVNDLQNFNMTTGLMLGSMAPLEVIISGAPTPAIILRGYLMPKPVP